MRAIAVAIGAILPWLLYALGLTIGLTPAAAILPPIWSSFENATVIHSSFVLLDQFLLVGIMGCLIAYIKARHSQSGSAIRMWSTLSGVSCAVAVGTKWTGICLLVSIALDTALLLYRRKQDLLNIFIRVLWFFAAFLCVYCAAWALHEALIINKHYAVNFQGWASVPSIFFDRLVWNHWSMIQGHLSIGPTDTFGSKWWQWLAGYRPLLFWQTDNATMYFFPNPIVWSGSIAFSALIFATLKIGKLMGIKMPSLQTKDISLLILTTAAANYLPNIFARRVLYLYHFLPTLSLMMIYNVWIMQQLNWVLPSRHQFARRVYIAAIVVPVGFFILTLPFSHGIVVKWGEVLKSMLEFQLPWR
jgi:dolichyl-phosphate-mannose--protein O-mannosyl transferase